MEQWHHQRECTDSHSTGYSLTKIRKDTLEGLIRDNNATRGIGENLVFLLEVFQVGFQ